MKRVSIITPTRNYARFLADALASVAQQQAPGVEIEHVVVDGASTDGTIELLEGAGSKVRWVSEPDSGQSDALNKGLAMATGDWIGWLNADEFYLQGAVRKVADAIDREPSVGLIYGDFVVVDEHGLLTGTSISHPPSKRVLRDICYIGSCATFFRRDQLPPAPFATDLRRIMDWDLYLNLAVRTQFRYIPARLSAFRRHAAQVTAEGKVTARDFAEHHALRVAHALDAPIQTLRRRHQLARTERVMRKLAGGGYVRQYISNRERGRSMRWFASSD